MKELRFYQPFSDTSVFAGASIELRQTFTSTSDNISSLKIRPFNPLLGGSQIYRLALIDEKNKAVRSIDISESNMGWGNLLRWDFSPLPSTQGKQFTLLIISGKANPDTAILSSINENRLAGTKIPYTVEEFNPVQKSYTSFSYSTTDHFPAGNLQVNGRIYPGDLEFYVYQEVNPLVFLKDITYEFPTKIKGDPIFFSFYFILLCLLSYAILRLKRKRVRI